MKINGKSVRPARNKVTVSPSTMRILRSLLVRAATPGMSLGPQDYLKMASAVAELTGRSQSEILGLYTSLQAGQRDVDSVSEALFGDKLLALVPPDGN